MQRDDGDVDNGEGLYVFDWFFCAGVNGARVNVVADSLAD